VTAARPIGAVLATRRTHQPVRRNSYDVDDARADVFRPIGDGTLEDFCRWRDSLWRAAREWNVYERQVGKGVPLPGGAMRVLEAILFSNQLDFRTGRLEPSLEVIGKIAGCAKDTVVRALAKFRRLGLVDWVRRTRPTGAAPGEGPKVKQETNAYFFVLGRLPKRFYARFRELLERQRKRAGERPRRPSMKVREERPKPKRGSAEWLIEQQLAKIAKAFGDESASPTIGQIPPSRE
jgi:hypothetical protein